MQFGKNRKPDSAVESGLPLTNYCQIESAILVTGLRPLRRFALTVYASSRNDEIEADCHAVLPREGIKTH